MKTGKTELYSAMETCFKTRWTFAWNYRRQNER